MPCTYDMLDTFRKFRKRIFIDLLPQRMPRSSRGLSPCPHRFRPPPQAGRRTWKTGTLEGMAIPQAGPGPSQARGQVFCFHGGGHCIWGAPNLYAPSGFLRPIAAFTVPLPWPPPRPPPSHLFKGTCHGSCESTELIEVVVETHAEIRASVKLKQNTEPVGALYVCLSRVRKPYG